MKETIALRQWWRDLETGHVWQVRQIHRADGIVEMLRPGDGVRPFTFGELGKRFDLLEDEG